MRLNGWPGDEGWDHGHGSSKVGLELFYQLCQHLDLGCHVSNLGGGDSGLIGELSLVGLG